MIQKLKEHDIIDPKTDSVIGTMACDSREIMDKLNEVVDAVNNQQIQLNNHECRLLDLQNQINEHDQEIDDCAATVSKMENVEPVENVAENEKCAKIAQDPYTEQRQWIGKICKFWNWDTGLAHYSKLITIKDINDGEMSNCPFRADDGGWYMYCEPVKPDDDIIYKGGDNE